MVSTDEVGQGVQKINPISSSHGNTPSLSSLRLQRVLLVICVASLLISLMLIYQHLTYKERVYGEAQANLKQLTVDASGKINSILQEAMKSAETLANGVTAGEINSSNMLARLKTMLADNPNYFGGAITFAPFGHDPKIRLYSAYYSKSGPGGALEFVQLADVYDYTTPAYDWYVEPMAKGNRWGEPYWDEAGKTYMTTYSAVFYAEDPLTHQKVPNGVVTIDISMNQIKRIIESLDIGPSGFGALTTRDGNYLYHPNHEYVLTHMNIRDVARQKGDNDRLLMADKAVKGEGGVIDHLSTTTGQKAWLIFETVPISGWSLQNTFIKDDLDIDVDRLRQQIIRILMALMVFGVASAALVLRITSGAHARVWLFTAASSLIFVMGIGVIWELALNYHSAANVDGFQVSEKARLKTLMNTFQETSRQKHLPDPIFIPTGLYIETLEFNGANDLVVTGRVWQSYPENYPKNLAKGIQFGRAKSVKIEKTNVETIDGGEVIQWSFQAVLRVDVDYSRYPLEVEHLGIQLLPQDPDQNLVLIPDLDAYKLLTATLLPGVDRDVFIPGWKLTDTFFLMQTTDRNTNFGIEQNFDRGVLPTLYYEIGMRRIFLDAFISNLTPLIVVAIILFALVLLSKRVEIGKILSVCVAVFFVVVFSHLDIRKSISAGEIFYLEYFFFVIYFAIILVPMDAFRISLDMRSRFFEYREGLLSQAIYWPSILGIFFIITVMKFY